MEKTTNFFLIHNFNTIPTELIDLCSDYIMNAVPIYNIRYENRPRRFKKLRKALGLI